MFNKNAYTEVDQAVSSMKKGSVENARKVGEMKSPIDDLMDEYSDIFSKEVSPVMAAAVSKKPMKLNLEKVR